MPNYIPKAGTLAERVCRFFLANPEEALTRGDIAHKFDAQPASIDSSLKHAVAATLLRRRAEDDGVSWSAGPALTAAVLAAAGPLGKRAPTPPMPDASALLNAIEKSVPLPSSKGLADFEKVWAAMEKGDSLVLESSVAESLSHHARHWGKANNRTFTRRRQADGTYRLWRTE